MLEPFLNRCVEPDAVTAFALDHTVIPSWRAVEASRNRASLEPDDGQGQVQEGLESLRHSTLAAMAEVLRCIPLSPAGCGSQVNPQRAEGAGTWGSVFTQSREEEECGKNWSSPGGPRA